MKKLYVIFLCFFYLTTNSQSLDNKFNKILEDHVKEFKLNYKNHDTILVCCENEFLNPFFLSSQEIILSNRLNIRKYIKKSTYMILFRFYIKENKMYISASHFKVEKKIRKINMINLMDGKEYYICDLVEKE